MMIYRRTITRTDRLDYLLIANSYISMIVASPLFMIMNIQAIYGYLYPNSSFEGWWCSIKSYALYINGSVYFYSFLLQAIYRCCRIVFHTRRSLRSFHLYVILSFVQWIIACVQVLPSLFIGDLKYLPNDYYCQLSPINLRSTIICLSLIFLIPYFSTIFCYIFTMYYVRMRRVALVTLRQNFKLRRDITILTHLAILLTFIITVAMPHIFMPIIYVLFGYAPLWASSFEWFTTLFSLVSVAIIQIFINPHLKKLFTRTNRVNIRTIPVQTVTI
ncbi:unnamed protein product [Rotaria sp. Silwood1]|nr:unnamed protein product [Rotaria sp. Silwood1]CAF1560081.1 unnamed protein product [Rotaria sp. Silwood1]CAF4635564.1 unnamed protein product [Rotaria sp. Silwood1]